MLQPKKTKFKKMHKGRNKGFAKNSDVKFGLFGMKAVERGMLTSRQIESARKVISHSTKRQSKIWIRAFPDKPITRKPLEIRMGKGKGNIEYWVAVIKPGKIIYEIDGVTKEVAKIALKLASDKLPFKTKFVSKN